MIKKLTTHGNSAALILDKPILKLLGITMETPLEITTDGRSLVVSPVADTRRTHRVRRALVKVNARHRKTLKKLAE